MFLVENGYIPCSVLFFVDNDFILILFFIIKYLSYLKCSSFHTVFRINTLAAYGGGAVYMVPPYACRPGFVEKNSDFFILEAVLLKLFIIFFRNFFSISLNFTNLKSSLNNIESIERLKVTASILIHNNTLQSFV